MNSSHVPVNTNEAYDPEANTWTTKTPMPTARHHLVSAVIDDKLYAIGGRILGNGVPSEDIDESLTNLDRKKTPESLARCAINLLTDTKRLDKLSLSALDHSKQFSWDKTADYFRTQIEGML